MMLLSRKPYPSAPEGAEILLLQTDHISVEIGKPLWEVNPNVEFKTIIHLECFFVYDVKQGSGFIILYEEPVVAIPFIK